MDTEDIKELRSYFFDENKVRSADSKTLKESCIYGLSMNKVQFVEAFEKLSGNSLNSFAASKLFERLDTKRRGFIKWEVVLDAIIDASRKLLENKD